MGAIFMNLNEFFGNHLCKLRNEIGLTQKQVANELNISVSTYANWEQGRREPNLYHLFELAKIFEVDMNELFDCNFIDSTK